jgi:hypothetical protein
MREQGRPATAGETPALLPAGQLRSSSNFRSITAVLCTLCAPHRKMVANEGRSVRLRRFAESFNDCLGVREMRSKLMLCVVFSLTSAAYAKDPKVYQTGNVVQMDSVPCGAASKDADSGGNKTHEALCQEYVLQSERVSYHIRPRDEKHAVILPADARAQFRLEKGKMMVRLEGIGSKEREYIVVSMTPQSDSSAADAMPVHLNHLQ